jgi:hypothetical protein
MADARAGAHHLHIAGLRAALVAETVLVADGTKTYAGDDRHVAMSPWDAAGSRCWRLFRHRCRPAVRPSGLHIRQLLLCSSQ